VQAVHTVKDIREALASAGTIGLVPTMGALHAGHEKLIETARPECDSLVVSIFVNPLQFGPSEDYSRYPRTLSDDLEICRQHAVDFVFAPSNDEMYRTPQFTFVDVTRVSEHLCGKFRPGHFRAVATVVMKLFNIVRPDYAFFGEKDMQQLAVIRRMVEDLNFPVRIVGVPTVRESDGLAMSSRNKYLKPEERKAAPILYGVLQHAASRIASGERDGAKVRQHALDQFAASPLIRVDYLEIVDPIELQPVTDIRGPVRIAGAIWLGTTRLIDNVTAE